MVPREVPDRTAETGDVGRKPLGGFVVMVSLRIVVVVVGAVVGICVRSRKDDVGTAVMFIWEGEVVVGSLVSFA